MRVYFKIKLNFFYNNNKGRHKLGKFLTGESLVNTRIVNNYTGKTGKMFQITLLFNAKILNWLT